MWKVIIYTYVCKSQTKHLMDFLNMPYYATYHVMAGFAQVPACSREVPSLVPTDTSSENLSVPR